MLLIRICHVHTLTTIPPLQKKVHHPIRTPPRRSSHTTTNMNSQFTTSTLRCLSNPSQQRWLVSRSLRVSAPPSYPSHLALQTRSFSASPSRTAEPYNPVREAEAKLKKQGKQQTMVGLSPEMQGLPLQGVFCRPFQRPRRAGALLTRDNVIHFIRRICSTTLVRSWYISCRRCRTIIQICWKASVSLVQHFTKVRERLASPFSI